MQGILFKDDMRQAIVDGRKTQTRRLSGLKEINKEPDAWRIYKSVDGKYWIAHRDIDKHQHYLNPRFSVGQVLYIKEAWRIVTPFTKDPYDFGILYSDGETRWWTDNGGEMNYPINEDKLHSPMFMPERFARYHIQISGVRIERLQSITLADCLAEGIHGYTFARGVLSENPPDPRWAYQELWDSINPKLPWAMNCWLVRYCFKLVTK